MASLNLIKPTSEKPVSDTLVEKLEFYTWCYTERGGGDVPMLKGRLKNRKFHQKKWKWNVTDALAEVWRGI